MKNLAINIVNDDASIKGQLDLYGDTKIDLEYVLSDIRDPQDRKISYTKEFTIPGTKNNNTLFMPFFQNGYSVTKFNPNIKLNAELTNGASLFSGALQLLKVTENNGSYEYEVIIYSKIVDFFNELGDAELKGSITLDEYNHELTMANIRNSWTNNIIKSAQPFQSSNGDGYVYPLDDRATATITQIQLPLFLGRDMRPAVFLKTYVDKIFQKFGWTYKSEFFNSDYFKKLIIPATDENWVGADADIVGPNGVIIGNANATCNIDTSQNEVIFKRLYPEGQRTKGESRFESAWKDLVWTNENSDPGGVYTGGEYKCNKAGLYDITAARRFSVLINNKLDFLSSTYQLRFLNDEKPYVIMELYDPATNLALPAGSTKTVIPMVINSTLPASYPATEQVCSTSLKIQLAAGQRVRCRYKFVLPQGQVGGLAQGVAAGTINIVWNPNGPLGNAAPAPNGSANIQLLTVAPADKPTADSFIVTLSKKDLQYGDIVPMNGAIPDKVKLKDLFTSLNNLFNLYWEPTDNFKELRIEPYETFFQLNKGKLPADDWTNKVDRKSDYEIYPMYELTASEYLFTYKEDKDWLNERYTVNNTEVFGEKKITIASDFITEKKTITPIFSPTPMCSLEFFDTKTTFTRMVMPSYTTRDINKKTRMSPNVRLLFWGGMKQKTSVFWELGYQTGVVGNIPQYYTEIVSGFPYAGHLDDPYNPTEDLNYGVPKEFNFIWSKVTNSNLYNKFWRNWLNSIIDRDAHMLACKVHLTQLDMANFDLKNFYQVDQIYYRVNKLSYNVDTEIADVELLRVFDYPEFVPSIGFYVNGGLPSVNPNAPTPAPKPPVPVNPGDPNPTDPVLPVDPNPQVPPVNNARGDFGEVTGGGNGWIGTWVNATPVASTLQSYTGTPWIIPSPVTSLFTATTADFIPRRNAVDASSFSNNNNAPNHDLITLRGFNNSISEELYGPVLVNGNNNAINSRVSNISILGSNNFIASGVENVQVFGDNQRIFQSNATYNNGIVTKNGISLVSIDLIRGGINEVQSVFNKNKIITNIRGGSDAIRNYGSQSPEELINGNIE